MEKTDNERFPFHPIDPSLSPSHKRLHTGLANLTVDIQGGVEFFAFPSPRRNKKDAGCG